MVFILIMDFFFRFSKAATSCQLCTNLITHMLNKFHNWTINYLNDFIGATLLVHSKAIICL